MTSASNPNNDIELNPVQDQKQLKQLLKDCRSSQRFHLSKKIDQLFRIKSDSKKYLVKLDKLTKGIQTSIKNRQSRLEKLPKPTYPDQLPVAERREEIIKTIRDNQVTIICGETGSGKTTQIPKMCLELGRGVDGIIGHTQPRRIAAKSVAARIAEELKTELGSVVGYKVRFHDQTKESSYIKLMTDGILLAEIRNDRYLNQYDTLIIDEAHERSLNIDFLLGYLRWLLPRRKDLKVIITSATIDPESFSRHFNFTDKKDDSLKGNAPIINVSGRTFPVEIRYHSLLPDKNQDESEKEEAKEKDMLQAVVDATDELMSEAPGGILIFFSGEREIRLASEVLRKHHKPSVEILPLFARLSGAEQSKIFNPSRGRRIILATNVAETSLTVPGIKYVIDTGLARISRYSWRSRVQRLPIEKISQASANQRSGRCGRTSSGIAIRLYAEDDFESRPEFTLPEIQRTNLASVILQLTSLNLGNVYNFPYVETPDIGMIRDGYKLLFELGAVTKPKGDNIKITQIGRELANFPTDPRLGRMLLAAKEYGVLEEVLIIVSALSIQDVRERPLDKQQASDQKHSRFKDENSDFISLLKLWDYYHEKNKELTQNHFRKLCKREFLSYMRLREWNETYRQLRLSSKENDKNKSGQKHTKKTPPHFLTKSIVKEKKKRHPLNTKVEEEDKYIANYNAIHQSLLTGLLSNIGFKEENNEFQGVNNRKFFVFPGSALHKKPPKWVMSAEIVDTSRLFARTVAKIQPEWVEYAAKHLLKYHYSEPRWEKRREQVVADEKSSLYGMIVTPNKKVNFGPIDPDIARQLFIRHALVYGEFKCTDDFFKHNHELIEEVEELEAKSRRRDILVDEEILYDFYDQLIPEKIYNGPAFHKWRKGFERKNPDALKLNKDYLMQRDDSHVQSEQYPDHLSISDMVLPLNYHFEPGKKDDGISVKVPAAALNQLSPHNFDYLVPGMLEEKITEFIKSLPKQVRKQFVPAPEYAKACLESINTDRTENPKNIATPASLISTIAEALRKITGHRIDEELLDDFTFSDHMQMRYEVVDESGKIIKAGRDLEVLKKQVGFKVSNQNTRSTNNSHERSGITEWDFETLPETIVMDVSGMKIKAWPALIDEGDSVAIKLFDSPQQAKRQNGLLKLVLLEYKSQRRDLLKQIPEAQKMCLHYASTGKCDELKNSIIENVFRLTFISGDLLDRKYGVGISKPMYLDHLEQNHDKLADVLDEFCQQLLTVLSLNHDIRKQLKGTIDISLLETLNDIKAQIHALVYPGFLNELNLEELRQYPRYLKAILKRLDKLHGDAHKDRGLRIQVQPLWDDYQKLLKKHGWNDELKEFRWLLEEFRVSLFAQDLGTAYPVSEKRLSKRFNEIKNQLS